MRNSCLLLLFVFCVGCSGCSGPYHETIAPGPVPHHLPVFTNGTNATNDPWISMNPIADQKKDQPFLINGSTNLPPRSIIEVIIVPSGFAAAGIRRLDDCVTLRQKCVLYFARANGTPPGPLHWSLTTDDSLNLFRNTTADQYTAIVENFDGNLTARSGFAMR